MAGDGVGIHSARDVALTTASTISALASMLVIASYIRYRSLRRHPSQLIMSRSVLDLLFSLTLIGSRIDYGSSTAAHPFNDCQVYSFLAQFCSVGAEGYFLMLSVDLVITITNPFSSYTTNLKRYHFIVNSAGIITAAILLSATHDSHHVYGRSNVLQVCWSGNVSSSEAVDPVTFGLFTIPLILVYAFAVGAVLFGRRRLRQGLPVSYQARMDVFNNSARYVAVYIVYWTVVGLLYIALYLVRADSPQWLPPVLAVFVGSRGVVTLSAWLWTHDIREAVRRARAGLDSSENKSLAPFLNQALRSEVLTYLTTGILRGISYAERKPGHHDTFARGRYYNEIKIARIGARLLTRAGSVSERRSVGFSSFQDMKHKLAITSKRSKGRLATIVSSDNTGYAPLLDPPTSRPGATPRAESSQELLTMAAASAAKLTPRTAAMRTRSISMAEKDAFSFHDYSPHDFKRIREIYDISNDDYAAAFGATAKERFSEGGSGAFMFMSSDQRFIVKTMSRSECHVLLDILPAYKRYIEQNPHSLIAKFFGCHSIKMYRRIIYFVVMENVLLSRATIHERYDLKGSWVNRHRRALGRGERIHCRHCNQVYSVGDPRDKCPTRPNGRHLPNVILKDNDLNIKLRLDRTSAALLANQVHSDIEFLRSQRIMDYSLLLGVHRAKYRLLENDLRRPSMARSTSVPQSPRHVRAASVATTRSVSDVHPPTGASLSKRGRHILQRTSSAAALGLLQAPGLPARVTSAPASGGVGTPRGGASGGAGAGAGTGRDTPLSGADSVESGYLPPQTQVSPLRRAAMYRRGRAAHRSAARDAQSVLDAVRSRRRQLIQREVMSGGLSLEQVRAHNGTGLAASIAAARTPRGSYGSASPFFDGEADDSDPLADGKGTEGGDGGVARARQPNGDSERRHGQGANVSLGGLAPSTSSRSIGGSNSPAGRAAFRGGSGTATAASAPMMMQGTAASALSTPAGRATGDNEEAVPQLKPLGEQPIRVSASANSLQDHLDGLGVGGGVQTEGVATAVEEDGAAGAHDGLPPLGGTWRPRRSMDGAPVLYHPEVMTPAMAVGDSGSTRYRGLSRASDLSAGLGAGAGSVQPFFKQHRGGLRAVLVEGPGVYYMGIIDVLQRWTWSKRLEYFVKTKLLCKNRHGISAVHFEEYADRFIQRVAHEIIDNYSELVDGSADPPAASNRSRSRKHRLVREWSESHA